MAAIQIKRARSSTAKSMARRRTSGAGLAVPLFVASSGTGAHVEFKRQKVDCGKRATARDAADPIYVLAGRDEGYRAVLRRVRKRGRRRKRAQGLAICVRSRAER